MKKYFNKLHYSQNFNLFDLLAFVILLIPSFFYTLAVMYKNALHNEEILKTEKLPVKVISIGNLTTGGTGKTPITKEIAGYLNSINKKVAIISRGYAGKLDINNTNIISDGEQIFYTAEMAGDEPYWLAKKCPGTVVITGKDRIKSGKLAIEKFNTDIILLDDGFQYRKLYRNLDIVLIDSIKLFGKGCLLPAGPLRESASELKRADRVIMVNKQPFDKNSDKNCKKMISCLYKQYGIENFTMCHIEAEKVDNISKVLAFTGIGQPDFFFNYLKEQNINIFEEKIFPDHYLYTKQDIKNLMARARAVAANCIVTTEKDLVKIEPFLNEIKDQIPVYALKLKVNLDVEELLKGIL